MNNSDIPIGTAIATMPYGYYPGKEESHKNSGIYLGQGVNASGQPGIVIIDQWPGHKARMRVITEGGQFPGDFSNDADAYYVITTPAVRDCGCGKQ